MVNENLEKLYAANLKQIEEDDSSDYHPHHNSKCDWCNSTDSTVQYIKNKGNMCSNCRWELR
jgi:hypothetical protein